MPADDDITGADVVIIGGGVVGLAIARAVLSASPALRVVVLDKEPSLGRHASGRNSGVIHAGFYYAPDSLKARLTARGNALLHTFCDEHGVAVRRCGKVVVAQQASDLPQLDALYQRGIDNGIRLEMIDRVALGDLEPLARTVDRAIWSPTTSVADPLAVLGALAADVRGRGGRIRTRAHVQDGRPGRLVVNGQSFPVSHVVNCAGLHADTVASWFGFCDDYVMLPFKGLYWHGRWPAGRMQRNVYPVPDPANPFLGVHLTVTPSGGVKVGPTAIPALWREEYRGMSNFDASEALQSLRQWPGLVRSEHHDARALLRSEVPKYLRRVLVRQARALVPSLDPADFRIRGRPGIRAQLWSPSHRRLEMDFVVRGDADSTHLLNIVSPGWTTSLAMAEEIVGRLRSRGVV